MSLGRLVDLVVLLVAIIGILVVQTSGAVILDELRLEFNQNPDPSFNQEQINNDTYTFVTKWVPTAGLFGAIFLVGWREYRRQRITARRGPRI